MLDMPRGHRQKIIIEIDDQPRIGLSAIVRQPPNSREIIYSEPLHDDDVGPEVL
jgi:hypothetical protein